MFASHMSYYDSHFFKSQAPRFNGNGLSYLTQMCWNDTLVFLPEHNLTYFGTRRRWPPASRAVRRSSTTELSSLCSRFRRASAIHRATQKYLLKKGFREISAEQHHLQAQGVVRVAFTVLGARTALDHGR